MKIETVSPDKFDSRAANLMSNGYTVVSQGDFGIVFQKKKTSVSNIVILLGIIFSITIVGAIVGIPMIIVGLIAKFCSGTNYNQITLRKG